MVKKCQISTTRDLKANEVFGNKRNSNKSRNLIWILQRFVLSTTWIRTVIPANILASDQLCLNILDQRWSNVENVTKSEGFWLLRNINTTSVSNVEATLHNIDIGVFHVPQLLFNVVSTLIRRYLNPLSTWSQH